jgi:hypothetical protein
MYTPYCTVMQCGPTRGRHAALLFILLALDMRGAGRRGDEFSAHL